MVLGAKNDVFVNLMGKIRDMRKRQALSVMETKLNRAETNLVSETFCTRNGFVIQKFSEDFQFHRSAICPISCVGPSVIDILARKPYIFTFKEACAILAHCDLRRHLQFVTRIIADYAILIRGLPQCPDEDLYLAVFFFIEEVFGIQSKLELCVKFMEDDDEIIGVVFDSMFTRREVLRKDFLLEGIDIEVDPNFDLGWIVDKFCTE